MTAHRLMRRLARSQAGFTIIEMMVAVLITTGGVAAMVATIDNKREFVSLSERREAAVHRAELEVERVHALEYGGVALTAAPAASADRKNPDFYVSGGSYQWDQDETPSPSEPLVVDSGAGRVAPRRTWSDGRLSGRIHTYVTWVDDPCCSGNRDYKRIVVAVTVDGTEGPPRPVLVSSIVTDTNATAD